MNAPTASRPLGVAILAVLVGLFGILLVIGGVLVLALGSTSLVSDLELGISGTSALLLGIIVLVYGLVVLGVAVGLWDLRMWALALAVIVLLVQIAFHAIDNTYLSVGFFVDLLLLIYLIAVSRHFS